MFSFVIMGNKNYYSLLNHNINFIRNIYPTAPILVYDWGDDQGLPGFSVPDANVTVIDWGANILDLREIRRQTTPEQQRDLALRYNARFKRTLGQRIRKSLLKRLPNSIFAAPLITAGLRFENMLLQKISCMRDALGRIDGGGLAFLDADAFLLKDLDDLFRRDDFDVGITLIDNPNWAHNQCAVINSGVIFFHSPRPGLAFLSAWLDATAHCDEWLREQTAMVRMLERIAPDLFQAGRVTPVTLGDQSIRVLALAGKEFNNNDMSKGPGEGTRIWHLANTAHNSGIFLQTLGMLNSGKT